MRTFLGVALAMALFACGEENVPQDPHPCVGDDCNTCQPETDAELCDAAGASCGALEAADRCGETRTLSCGGCLGGEVCEDLVCVEKPGEEEPEESPCLLVPKEGICAHVFSLERCVETEEGERVVTEDCGIGETCVHSEGSASCQPMAACEAGIGYCTEDGNLRRCEGGMFVETTCPDGCRTGGEARCLEPVSGAAPYVGEILYEHRVPNETLTGWGTPELRPAAGLVVSSFRDGAVVDMAAVADDGTFEILVPEDPAQIRLIFAALESLMGGESARIAVVDPDLPPGMHQPSELGPQATYWSWATEVPGDEPIVITEERGSGAIQVFQALRHVVRHIANHKGFATRNLTGWWAPGVDFSCGACYMDGGEEPGGFVAISGGDFEAGANDAVLFHESGHHAFTALGPRIYEGGQHCIGVPAPPGQALSEGHASWYAADRMKQPRIFGAQQGTFSFWDIDRMHPIQYFAPPTHAEGPTQSVNETWVSAVLWHLAKERGSSLPVHAALYSPEMTAPYASGYTGKLWWEVDRTCRPVNPQDTGYPTPILFDLLDGLLCDGFPAEPVQAHVEPHLPYDALAPTCK